jgi:hypothetical protein
LFFLVVGCCRAPAITGARFHEAGRISVAAEAFDVLSEAGQISLIVDCRGAASFNVS